MPCPVSYAPTEKPATKPPGNVWRYYKHEGMLQKMSTYYSRFPIFKMSDLPSPSPSPHPKEDSLDLPELVTITEDQVHVFVKSLKGADEDAAVLQDAAHPVVNVLQHLAALSHSHDCRSTKSNVHSKVSGSLRPKGGLQIKV